MATGASTADVAIVLIDAAAFAKHGGLLPQSRRHTFIASLLQIPHVVAAVNKMDLIGYGQAAFEKIKTEYLAMAEHLGLKSVEVIPVSALAGDNIVNASANMPWYTGPTLLEYLETVPVAKGMSGAPLRFLCSSFCGRTPASAASPVRLPAAFCAKETPYSRCHRASNRV